MKRVGFWSGVIKAARAVVVYGELLMFVIGLMLFAAGLSWAWPPAGLIGAGGVLMAVSLFGGGKTQ